MRRLQECPSCSERNLPVGGHILTCYSCGSKFKPYVPIGKKLAYEILGQSAYWITLVGVLDFVDSIATLILAFLGAALLGAAIASLPHKNMRLRPIETT